MAQGSMNVLASDHMAEACSQMGDARTRYFSLDFILAGKCVKIALFKIQLCSKVQYCP